MDEAVFLGAIRPLAVRHRGSFRDLNAALVKVHAGLFLSHKEFENVNPALVLHTTNSYLKNKFGPVDERTQAQHIKVTGWMVMECTAATVGLTTERVCAIIDRVLGDPLTSHEQEILEGSE